MSRAWFNSALRWLPPWFLEVCSLFPGGFLCGPWWFSLWSVVVFPVVPGGFLCGSMVVFPVVPGGLLCVCVVCSMVSGGFLCGSHWIIPWLVWFTPWFSQRLISNEEQSVHVHSGGWGPCRPERMFSRDFLCCPRSERSVNLRERKQQRWAGAQGPWIPEPP